MAGENEGYIYGGYLERYLEEAGYKKQTLLKDFDWTGAWAAIQAGQLDLPQASKGYPGEPEGLAGRITKACGLDPETPWSEVTRLILNDAIKRDGLSPETNWIDLGEHYNLKHQSE